MNDMKWTVHFSCFEQNRQMIDYVANKRDFKKIGRDIVTEWENKNNDIAGAVTFHNEAGGLYE